jgi:hypothetical protein
MPSKIQKTTEAIVLQQKPCTMVLGKEAIDAGSYKVYSLEMTEVTVNPDEIAWRERKWEERDAIEWIVATSHRLPFQRNIAVRMFLFRDESPLKARRLPCVCSLQGQK